MDVQTFDDILKTIFNRSFVLPKNESNLFKQAETYVRFKLLKINKLIEVFMIGFIWFLKLDKYIR